jgi:hypothetical protein
MANVVSPEWLCTLLLVIVLSFASFKTITKGRKQWAAEHHTKYEPTADAGPLKLSHRFPAAETKTLVFVWLAVFALTLVKGGSGNASIIGIAMCSGWYWLAAVLIVPVGVWGAGIGRKRLLARQGFSYSANPLASASAIEDVSEEAKSMPKEEIAWSTKNTVTVPLLMCCIGAIAAFSGIGGGMLIGPMLLGMGVPNERIPATSALTVLFSSSSVFVQYLILGVLPLQYASLYMAVTFFAAVLGLAFVRKAVRKTGRASIVVFCLAGVILLSMIMILLNGVTSLLSGADMGFDFDSLCEA